MKDFKLTAGIHTLTIRTSPAIETININQEVISCCEEPSGVKHHSDGSDSCRIIINPNKMHGEVFCYSEFETAMDTIAEGIGSNSYEIRRADLKLDSYNEEHHQKFLKLNRYLISLLANAYETKNNYITYDLFTHKHRSTAAKCNRFDIEHYDKDIESDGKDIAKSRLELRSKNGSPSNIEHEFRHHWFLRLNKAIRDKNIESTLKRINDELEKIYFRDKDSEPVQFTSLKEFVSQYQQCIFTKKQLIELLSRLEIVEKPEQTATYIKKKCKIEFISYRDLNKAVNEIKRAINYFFDH